MHTLRTSGTVNLRDIMKQRSRRGGQFGTNRDVHLPTLAYAEDGQMRFVEGKSSAMGDSRTMAASQE